MKHVFLKVLQNLQDNTCAGISFLMKLRASSFIKKGPQLYYKRYTDTVVFL